ncbi:MAG: hypothetical protein A2Z98_15260 [Spirochaetes bacterium GWB1_27_13]|nr:MAG: hypothetical protein A2Z98_15260 [Spirochaetes bacterium GWB1_27_13]
MKLKFCILFLLIAISAFSVDVTLDENNDKKIDRWLKIEVYKDWKLLDVNGNDKPDESCFYVSEKNIVYLIFSDIQDYDADGKPDIFMTVTVKGKSFFKEIKIDSNNDGKIDLIRYEEKDKVYLQKSDENFNGKFDKIEEYNSNGVKIKESMDKITPEESTIDYFEKEILAKVTPQNKNLLLAFYEKNENERKYIMKKTLKPDDYRKIDEILFTLGYNNEKMDDIYYFDENGTILKEEHDTNNDTKPDMWVKYTYNAEGGLKDVVIEKDDNFDGKVDEWHYSNNKRQIIKVEKDTDFDGKIDSVKNY